MSDYEYVLAMGVDDRGERVLGRYPTKREAQRRALDDYRANVKPSGRLRWIPDQLPPYQELDWSATRSRESSYHIHTMGPGEVFEGDW